MSGGPCHLRRSGRSRSSRGASLVEVLVAVLVLSLGLLGLAALQARALKGNVSSVQRTQAVMLSQYMMEMMRVDRQEAMGGSYNTGSAFVCSVSSFGNAGLAQTNLGTWLSTLKSQIGRTDDTTTCVQVACNATGACTVQIRWDDSASGGLPDLSLAIASRL